MESEEDLGLLASTSFDPVDVLIRPLPVDTEKEEHKWKEEEQEQKNKEQKRKEEEEKAEIEAARQEVLKRLLSRTEIMKKMGCPVYILPLAYVENFDYRELLKPLESNCEEFDCGSGPVPEEIVLAKEKELWNAAMEYRKAQNMEFDYDLIPSHMTLYPIMSKNCMWYHCNLVGCKRATHFKGVEQYFFLEMNLTWMKTVTACITLDDNVDNTCNRCPSRIGLLHPRKGGFTCGSKEGPSKEDSGATSSKALDGDVALPSLHDPLPALGDDTLGPISRRLSAMVGGETSRTAAAAIDFPFKYKSLTAMSNERPKPITEIDLKKPITERQLKIALAFAGS